MARILDFERYGADLNRELLRRIGYTNGLHKLRRFARVAEYVYPIMPTSARMLAQVIMQQENSQSAGADLQLKGSKYATGIIDVARALMLLEKFGPKIALTSQGYACHALNQTSQSQKALDAFLFHKVVEADGEYTLNILRLVSEGFRGSALIGEALVSRFLQLIKFKMDSIGVNVPDRFAKQALLGLLNDAERTLRKAVENKSSSVEFFYKHTVNPRLEWLVDLGFVGSPDAGVTFEGSRVLKQLSRLGGWKEEFIFLPLDQWLSSHLELPSLYDSQNAADFSWNIVAAPSRSDDSNPPTSHIDNLLELLEDVRAIYPFVKLANFNEVDALSVYEVLASREADKGRIIPYQEYETAVATLAREYPSEIFRLSKRRGKGLYLALKNKY